MRVLVCGGRDYAGREVLFATLDAIHAVTPIEVLIEGGANGADALAASWARVREVSHWRVPANWRRDGRGAGAIRNQRMLTMCEPNLVVAFPGGNGTADMIDRSHGWGVKVHLGGGDPIDPRQTTIFDVEGVAQS